MNKCSTLLTAEIVEISIQAAEYMRELVEQSNLLFVVYGHIEELNQSLSTMRVVTLLPPELTIKVYLNK